jgi:hypothetical protein
MKFKTDRYIGKTQPNEKHKKKGLDDYTPKARK